jgi:hypothetical protein
MRKRSCLICRDTLHSGVCDIKMQGLYLLVFVTWYWLYRCMANIKILLYLAWSSYQEATVQMFFPLMMWSSHFLFQMLASLHWHGTFCWIPYFCSLWWVLYWEWRSSIPAKTGEVNRTIMCCCIAQFQSCNICGILEHTATKVTKGLQL